MRPETISRVRSFFAFGLVLSVLACLFFTACGGTSADELTRQGQERLAQDDYKGAIIFFKSALEKDAGDTTARRNLAVAYSELGKPDKAASEYEALLKNGVTAPDVLLEYAEVALALEQSPKAEELAQKVLASATDTKDLAAAHGIVGIVKVRARDHQAARESLEKALELDPNQILPGLNLAVMDLRDGNTDQAASLLERLVSSFPEDTRAQYLLVTIALSRQQNDKAIALLEDIAKRDPEDANAVFRAGKIAFDNGKQDLARQKAQLLKEKFANSPHGYLLAGMLAYAQENFDETINQVSESVSRGNSLLADYYLGLAYQRQNRLDLALNHFLAVLEKDPANVSAIIMLSNIYGRQGLPEEALMQAEKAVKMAPKSASAHTALGDAYLVKRDTENAAKEYAKAVALAPDQADAHLKLGMAELRKGNAELGEAELRQFIAGNSDEIGSRALAHNLLLRARRVDSAQAILREGLNGTKQDALLYNFMASAAINSERDLDKGLAFFDSAQEADPGLKSTYFGKTRVYVAKGDQESARKTLEDLLKLDPENPRALYELGGLYRLDGQKELAREYFERALETGNRPIQLNIVALLARDGDVDRAASILDGLIQKDPTFAQPGQQIKGEVYLANKQYDKALESYRQFQSSAPLVSANRQIRVYLEQKDYAKALELAKSLTNQFPAAPTGHYIAALVHQAQGDAAAAAAAVKKGLAIVPEDPLGLDYLGRIQIGAGELQKAQATYDKLVEILPENPAGYFGRGVAWEQRGNAENAIQEYTQALRKDTEYVPALNNLANLFLEQGQNARLALFMAMRAYMQQPDAPNISDTAGLALLANGRQAEAVPLLENAAARLNDNPTVLYHLGQAYAQTGQKDKAKDILTRALELGDFKDSGKARELLESL